MTTLPTYKEYSAHQRRLFLYATFREDPPSLRKQAEAVSSAFDVPPPSPATIANDWKWLEREHKPDEGLLQELLLPQNFAEFRNRFFKAPGGGEYQTPPYQQAWAFMLHGFVFKEEIPQWVLDLLGYPADLNATLLDGETLMTAINLAPPRHGKTEFSLHGITQVLCRDPSKRIIYCSGISQTSTDNMGLVMQEMETNEALIEAYGPFKSDDKRWSYKNGFFLAKAPAMKTPNIHPIGVRSNILSKDADLILVDDPQDLDAAESELTTLRDYRWFTTNLMTRREPHTPVLGFGSHQPSQIGDLWALVEENIGDLNTGSDRTYLTKMKAHDVEVCGGTEPHEACVLWPEVRPYWYLEALRARLGDEMFEVCFNQDAREGRVNYFEIEQLRGEYSEGEIENGMVTVEHPYKGGILDRSRSAKSIPKFHCNPGQQLFVTVGVDPAASEARRASHTAIVVLAGCRTCKRRFVVDYLQIKQSPEKHPSTILSFVEAYQPQRVRIEKNAYQAALARDPRLTGQQGVLGFRIDEWHTDDRKNDPSLGIPTIQHMIKEGRLSVPWQHVEDQEYMEEFIRAFIRWPKKPNDIPMAMWLAELSLRELLHDSEFATPLVFDGWAGQIDPTEVEYESPYTEVFEVDVSDIYEEQRSWQVW